MSTIEYNSFKKKIKKIRILKSFFKQPLKCILKKTKFKKKLKIIRWILIFSQIPILDDFL